MEQEETRKIVERICAGHPYLAGFAELEGLLNNEYSRYKYGISLARKLDDDIIDAVGAGPTKEYFNLYNEINRELDETTSAIETALRANGIDALGIKATLSDYALDQSGRYSLQSKISHKMIATRSGLGWIGKTGLLVTKKFGPRVRLASVLLTVPVKPDFPPVESSLCGKCDICVKSCPSNAANGLLWNKNVKREDFLDPHVCRDRCRGLSRARINEDVSICGICVSVCPVGK